MLHNTVNNTRKELPPSKVKPVIISTPLTPHEMELKLLNDQLSDAKGWNEYHTSIRSSLFDITRSATNTSQHLYSFILEQKAVIEKQEKFIVELKATIKRLRCDLGNG